MGKKASRGPASGIAVGFNKGHIVKRRNLKAQIKKKPRKRTSTKKELIKDVVTEIVGFAPYEKRLMEFIKVGTSAALKKSLKYAKKKLGTHKRGKTKRDELQKVVIMQRRKAAQAHAHGHGHEHEKH
ncbi:60S ribosomal protein L36 [Hepatocystis sp. ex Piliocolobus tephrosceles]|nr:60S ribosomal protein L36 [Hepatocystis sp. ex Piliocolobus tephrosceles]